MSRRYQPGAPTHNLCVQRRPVEEGDDPGPNVQVGVAWLNDESGHVSIVLNDGVVLDWRMRETHYMTLYKRRDRR